MPISVKATFAQEGVFFAGERLNCTITFTNSASGTSSNGHGSLPSRPTSALQQKLYHHLQDPQHSQQQGESNGAGHSAKLPQQSIPPTGSAFSPTSPTSTLSTVASPFNSPLNVDTRALTRPTQSLSQAVNGASSIPKNGSKSHQRTETTSQRPNNVTARALSQGRLSSDVSHIDAIAREPSQNGQSQGIAGQEQDDQDSQETVVPLPRTTSEPSSPPHSPNMAQQPVQSQQDGLQQPVSSPGLLGLASFMYRSASFSSLASAFGLAGGEAEPQRPYADEKKLPPLPPPEHVDADSRHSRTVLPPLQVMSPDNEEETTTKESLHGLQDETTQPQSPVSSELARMGTPIGLGLGTNGQTTPKGGDSTVAGLGERMIELQVTDNADTQSVIDESELYQTPRPSMDYSTRSSMQSVRGPFQSYQERPSRRSSLMSNYSINSGQRTLTHQGSKKESLLWGSVQVVGQFMVDGSFIRQQGFESLKSKTMYRPTGSSGGGAIGGGTLGAVNPSSSTYSDWRERANTNRLFPVFSTPPSILFVDLQLGPGESTSYTYQIEIPSDLPPSHRGKTIRFAYNLVLGVQRGSVHTPAKSVQIPFRLYNNISELGTRPVYDLMNPVILHKDTAISNVAGQGKTVEKICDNPKLARKQFEDYVDELIRNIRPDEENSPRQTRELTRRESDAYKDEDMVLNHTCLEKVALLARSTSSASYDICKNNVPVAKLSLIKTRFKLGETVHGVISFTAREVPTYQISVTLETVEAIEPSYACRSAVQTAKLTKRVHAELHESCIDTMRTSFSLCIPPTATPEFKTTTLTLKWYLRVEFMTGPANQPRFKMTSVDERRSQYHAVESLSTESFDCSVPIQVYPTSYETGALFPPAVSFNLA